LKNLTPFLLLACLSAAHAGREQVLVSTAASMNSAMKEVAAAYGELYPATEIAINAGASGVLMRQIEHGAPVDLFISASSVEIDRLAEQGLVLQREPIASSRLVVAVPKGSLPPARFERVADERFVRIAIGNPSTVPAGRYAREALRTLGVWDEIQDRLIPGENARQVLDWVATGEVDAGLVYLTDVALVASRVDAGPAAPSGSHRAIVYEAAVLETATDSALGEHVLEFLISDTGRRILERKGFAPPPQ
jgi:molybdate transport system substrate-binding protein